MNEELNPRIEFITNSDLFRILMNAISISKNYMSFVGYRKSPTPQGHEYYVRFKLISDPTHKEILELGKTLKSEPSIEYNVMDYDTETFSLKFNCHEK